MGNSRRPKSRDTLDEILAGLSGRMFPAEMGQARVTIHSQEPDGDGVLHTLLYGRSLYPVRTLIDAGADVNLIGNQGFTPLHVAAWTDHLDAVDMLLGAGANAALRNAAGQTALDIALENGFQSVAKRLRAT
ncbi:ankyrin repeat domain-containing protein [Roseovarius aestuarii]|nr:ankyrin repeat domain-containing protein [Roseovarius aestuarii]